MNINTACILLFWLIIFVVLTATLTQNCKIPSLSDYRVGGMGNPIIHGGRVAEYSSDSRRSTRDYNHDFKRDSLDTEDRQHCINYGDSIQYKVPHERTF
jgi:hypothetical protein